MKNGVNHNNVKNNVILKTLIFGENIALTQFKTQ